MMGHIKKGGILTKMKALVLTAPEQLSLQDVNAREPEADEIMIQVKACGICGTDLHMFHGDKGAFENSFPLIMGHEFSGIIVKTGSAVTTFKSGDHVAVDPNVYCGHCSACLKGDVHFCENMLGIGTTVNGGFAEYCTVKSRAAYRVPETLPFEYAAMMEPVSCCLHGIDRSNIHPGNTVAVIGFGAIGQIIFQLALCSGAARVVVVETDASKRSKAMQMGAALAVDPLHEDVAARVREEGILSLDTVIECVGKKETMEMAVGLASNRATVMLFGLTSPGAKLEILAFEQIFKKELTITGSYINPLVSQRVIDLIAAKRIDLSKIVTDRIPLRDGVKAFTDQSYRSHGKIVVGDF